MLGLLGSVTQPAQSFVQRFNKNGIGHLLSFGRMTWHFVYLALKNHRITVKEEIKTVFAFSRLCEFFRKAVHFQNNLITF
jgi:hypothetical protein